MIIPQPEGLPLYCLVNLSICKKESSEFIAYRVEVTNFRSKMVTSFYNEFPIAYPSYEGVMSHEITLVFILQGSLHKVKQDRISGECYRPFCTNREFW